MPDSLKKGDRVRLSAQGAAAYTRDIWKVRLGTVVRQPRNLGSIIFVEWDGLKSGQPINRLDIELANGK
jgi:hypothetical protein